MKDDLQISTKAGCRAKLFRRINGSYYVISPMGTMVEVDAERPAIFSVCAEMLQLTVDDLVNVIDPCPATESVPSIPVST